VVGRPPPLDPANEAIAPDHGQLQGGVADPKEDLPRAAELSELGEHEPENLLDPLVRIELDPPVLAPDEAGRQREADRAVAGLAVPCRETALSEKVELVFGHRAFQAQLLERDDPRFVHFNEVGGLGASSKAPASYLATQTRIRLRETS
jgi:hypothetical protein